MFKPNVKLKSFEVGLVAGLILKSRRMYLFMTTTGLGLVNSILKTSNYFNVVQDYVLPDKKSGYFHSSNIPATSPTLPSTTLRWGIPRILMNAPSGAFSCKARQKQCLVNIVYQRLCKSDFHCSDRQSHRCPTRYTFLPMRKSMFCFSPSRTSTSSVT